jgi:RIO kinase 1
VFSEWQKKYPDLVVLRRLKSGKEADLWLVGAGGNSYALKVYIGSSLSTRAKYNAGQWIQEASLRKAVKQKTKVGKALQQRLWTKREYYLLKKLHTEGAIVSEVYAYTDTAILMQYLGDEREAAPRLGDIRLDDSIKLKVLETIERSMQLFLDNGIVHADLSSYNILWWDNKPWIIDFPQAADIRYNPNWRELYERDIENVRKYFA